MSKKAVFEIVLTLLVIGMPTSAFSFDVGQTSASSGWATVTVDSARTVGFHNSIALDSGDNPHISYQDVSNRDLKYAFYKGTTWHIETIDTAGWTGVHTSIALDSGDNPHISYYDGTNRDLKYAFYNGTAWHIETIDSDSYVSEETSIALDSSDNPHISYFDCHFNWTNGDLKYAFYNGTAWHIETVDTAGTVGRYSSIALDSSDHPHISYQDDNHRDLKYAFYNGTAWHIETVDTAGDVGRYSSIALDSSDHPHISYYDGTNGDLKYAFYDGTWYIETVDSAGTVGFDASIALDSGDNPHISYYDGTNGDLKYAFYDGTWYIETVDGLGWTGDFQYHTSIALDNGDWPHISYYDDTNNDLKYAHAGPVHDVAVTDVASSKNIVEPGSLCEINVTVMNIGDFGETFNVTAYASATAVDTFTGITLASRTSTTIILTWNTTGFVEGVYTISASVTPVPGEMDTADNTYVDGLVIVGTGPPGNLWVDPPLTDNLQEGDTFVVDIMVNITDPDPLNSPPDTLAGIEYKLKWNNTVLDVVGIDTHGDTVDDAPAGWNIPFVAANTTLDLGNGFDEHFYSTVTLSGPGMVGVYSFCTYTFRAMSYGECTLDIYDDKLVDDFAELIPHLTCDGHCRIPSKVPVHDVAITGIVLSKTVVGQGLPMHINVAVANEGDFPESFSVAAYCNTTPIATQAIILAAGDSTTITFTWNTTGFAKGNYTISANATIVPDETDTGDNSYTDGTVRVNIVGDVVPEYGVVDIVDIAYVAIHFGAKKGEPEYEPNADINSHGIIDIVDIVIVAIHFGETDS